MAKKSENGFSFPIGGDGPHALSKCHPTSIVVFDLPGTVPVLNFQLHIMLF